MAVNVNISSQPIIHPIAEQWRNILTIDAESPPATLQNDLISGITSIAVLRNKLPSELIEPAIAELEERRGQISVNTYPNGALTTFGPYLNRHIDNPKQYFLKAEEIANKFPPAALRIRKFVYNLLRDVLAIDAFEAAVDPIYGPYSPQILRLHSDGVANPLHRDHIAQDAADSKLLIRQINAQLSCIVCLKASPRGGILRHFGKFWQSSDDKYKITGNLGYEMGAVDGVSAVEFTPQTGDIYLINPVYFHEISKVEGGDRITLGFFFGYLESNRRRAVAWS